MAGYIKGVTIEFGANTEKLNNALKQTQGTINKTQAELKQINRSLKFNPGNTTLLNQKFDLLTRSVGETTVKLNQLKKMQKEMDAAKVDKTSAQYRQLEREIVKTDSQLKEAEAELKRFGSVGRQQALAVGQAFRNAGAKISSAGRTMTTNVTAPLALGFAASAKYASDLDENLNKLDVAFGKNADSVKKWAQVAGKSYGLSQVQATDMASAFGALGKGIGLSEKESAKMSKTLAGLSADLGSYFNVSTDESAKALEGIFTGESEALKKFGVVMTDTNLKQFAADQGLVWTQMSQTDKTMLRYQYVLAKTKDAQGDFSRTSDGTANSIKMFQASIQDLASNIGKALLPIITPVVQKLSELVSKFNQLSPGAQKIITLIGLLVAAIGPALLIIGGLASTIGGLITVFSTLGISFTAIAAPIGIAVAAIAGIIAVGVLLYKNWDTIKAKATAAWNKIKSTVTTAVKAIKTTVTSTFNTLKNTVTNTWNGIKNAITHPIETAKSTLKRIVGKIKDFFPINLGKIVSFMLPNISVGSLFKKIGGKRVSAPKFAVNGWSAHASGGIFPRPTLLQSRGGAGHVVGEAGAEAIIPLSELWSHMNALGDSIVNGVVQAGAMGGNGGQANITLYAFPNGPQMGSWVVNTYDTYKRRLG